jgi:hypothetical protein
MSIHICLVGGQSFHANKHKGNTQKPLSFLFALFSSHYHSVLLVLKICPNKQCIIISDLSYCINCSEILVVMHSISRTIVSEKSTKSTLMAFRTYCSSKLPILAMSGTALSVITKCQHASAKWGMEVRWQGSEWGTERHVGIPIKKNGFHCTDFHKINKYAIANIWTSHTKFHWRIYVKRTDVNSDTNLDFHETHTCSSTFF